MVKFYEGSFLYKFPWDQVAQGFWSRYPNPHSQHVLSEDVLRREVMDNKLVSLRLLTKTNRIPKWGERFVSHRIISILEESVVDPVNRTITTYTKNIGAQKVLGVEEMCIYQQSTDNPKWTVVERKARITSGLFGVARAIETFGLDRFHKNSLKASYGFEHILQNMFSPPTMAITPPQGLLQQETAKFKETAKKATELAKSRAGPLVASCSASTS